MALDVGAAAARRGGRRREKEAAGGRRRIESRAQVRDRRVGGGGEAAEGGGRKGTRRRRDRRCRARITRSPSAGKFLAHGGICGYVRRRLSWAARCTAADAIQGASTDVGQPPTGRLGVPAFSFPCAGAIAKGEPLAGAGFIGRAIKPPWRRLAPGRRCIALALEGLLYYRPTRARACPVQPRTQRGTGLA